MRLARRLRQPEGSGKDRWPREWIAYERYRIVHESNVAALIAEGVVTDDDTHFSDTRHRGEVTQAFLRGAITTASGGVLHVNKRLAVRTRRGRLQVLTALYNYHGLARRGGRLVDVVRYDNAHGDTGTLHRHVYDDEGRELGTEPVAPERLPPLDDVVREVEQYARQLRDPPAGGA